MRFPSISPLFFLLSFYTQWANLHKEWAVVSLGLLHLPLRAVQGSRAASSGKPYSATWKINYYGTTTLKSKNN